MFGEVAGWAITKADQDAQEEHGYVGRG